MFRRGRSVDKFTIDGFREALHQRFVLRANPGEELDLELVAVNDLSASARSIPVSGRAPFSIHFRGPCTPWARQHTYSIANERLGEMHIFVVPLGPDGQGMIYEAIFG
jgi:hypothetical protein